MKSELMCVFLGEKRRLFIRSWDLLTWLQAHVIMKNKMNG